MTSRTPRMSADEYQRRFGRNPKLPEPTAVLGCPVRTAGIVNAVKGGKKSPDWVGPTEKQLQAAIAKTLRAMGYNVDETSQRRASGVTIGMADLLVNRETWGPVWLQVEVKRSEKAPWSPAQVDRVRRGVMIVVWTVQSAVDAVTEWDRRLGK